MSNCSSDGAASADSGLGPEAALGLTLSLMSVVLTNIALLIQKHSAHVEAGRPLHRRYRFWAGFLLNTGSEVGLSAPAQLFAPLALLAPTGGVAVAFNALIARFGCVCGIREELSLLGWLATLCITSGVVLVAVAGPGGSSEVCVDQLSEYMTRPAFLAWLCPSVLLVATTLTLFPPVCPGNADGASKPGPFGRWRHRVRPSEDSSALTALSAVTAAACGAFSVLSLKIVMATISQWASGAVSAPPPLSFLCFVALLTCAPMQLYILNLSLASGKATFAIPIYLSVTMLFMSFLGGTLFAEFDSLLREPYPLFLCLYVFGCLMVLLGLLVLAREQRRRSHTAIAPELSKRRPPPVQAPDDSAADVAHEVTAAEPSHAAAAAAAAVALTPTVNSPDASGDWSAFEPRVVPATSGSPVPSPLVESPL